MVLDDSAQESALKHLVNGSVDHLRSILNTVQTPPTLLSKFIEAHKDLIKYRTHTVKVDGQTLTTSAVVAAARHSASVKLDDSKKVKERVDKSRQVVVDKVATGVSIYGLSTGFGGSADTRTDQPLMLGHALLQHQHMGITPVSGNPPVVLPLQDPSTSTTMPESWVRAAILIRMNSLIRGHSGVRWELIEKMNELLTADVIPVIPLRGSISASGAGTLVGNASIQVYDGPRAFGPRQKVPSCEGLKNHSIEPIALASKEHLGLVNGTAVSAGVAALAIDDAMHLALLAQVCTAMGTEALNGTRGSYASFIHSIARPHPGQVECAKNIYDLLHGSKLATLHEEEVGLNEDRYSLRQDRYPLRTSPQFLGPQIEDILSALTAVTQECNSTTDNPLVESETGIIHHGGNFQAMAITNAMEKTRLALHHIGKLLFSQSTELCNPAMNNGLPPSLAATDPSLNYHGKGIDIASASYVAELGYLAAPVSTHIQSAEMHNQAVNSLALISARATITSLDVLSMLIASYLYLLCQALDLRTLRSELLLGIKAILDEELTSSFGTFVEASKYELLSSQLFASMEQTFDKTTVMDSADQMRAISSSTTPAILGFFNGVDPASCPSLNDITQFQSRIATKARNLHHDLRHEFLTGARGPTPASGQLGKTKGMYEFVRKTLGIKMHGLENFTQFPNAIGTDDVSIGQNISKIYEAIRDGQVKGVVLSMLA
ncbi:Phenylalanine ammonia-lyase [Psilocybe cubensis]|uniref:Phenylalanine ammonia-lyase n=1 Tax=Psilocybe cubensis TaxID=181762 RepID=A0ACB8HBS0_PSICU|nr:Phenylalanine ammonia-lyase [Psilocybe cubensis]KAH9485448.1 Phenylalanine ammonia-lyase [Psilocybe cubensis]